MSCAPGRGKYQSKKREFSLTYLGKCLRQNRHLNIYSLSKNGDFGVFFLNKTYKRVKQKSWAMPKFACLVHCSK